MYLWLYFWSAAIWYIVVRHSIQVNFFPAILSETDNVSADGGKNFASAQLTLMTIITVINNDGFANFYGDEYYAVTTAKYLVYPSLSGSPEICHFARRTVLPRRFCTHVPIVFEISRHVRDFYEEWNLNFRANQIFRSGAYLARLPDDTISSYRRLIISPALDFASSFY